MFIGHFAVGLGAKKLQPKINLAILFIACQFLDLIWPSLVLLGVEIVKVDHHATVVTPFDFIHYPYSHSLIMTAIYSIFFAIIVGWYMKDRLSGIISGTVVMSHWILDFITHRPDLPIGFSGEKYGLGLWNNLFFAFILESALFIASVLLYNSMKDFSRNQKISFWIMVCLLYISYFANVFGPKPPVDLPASMIAGPALFMWIFVIWAYFIDREIVRNN
ncbi:MAG: hypothetical protein H6622_08510 [Halobacteriovoraceae bacterium]|nr:hypothetical protein [Halobacteriovoraceae bacterium]